MSDSEGAGKKPPVSWIYSLTKEQLIEIMSESGLEVTGTVDALRKRMSAFLKHRVEDGKQTRTGPSPGPSNAPLEPINTVPICEQVRKWGLNFDGIGDAVAFLERIQELQECYGLPSNDLLKAIPLLFRGESLLWYRNSKMFWRTWDDFITDFKLQYLPPRYDFLVEEEVRARMQKPRENFKVYLTAMLTLIRRGRTLRDDEVLERVYNNMRPEYKFYARRGTFLNLRELSALAAEYEGIAEEQKNTPTAFARPSVSDTRQQRPSQAVVATEPVTTGGNQVETSGAQERIENPRGKCWRCGRAGHARANCRNRQILFCSRCGRLNITSRDCRCAGNANPGGSRS